MYLISPDCPDHCASCDDPDVCDDCATGYFLESGACSGKFKIIKPFIVFVMSTIQHKYSFTHHIMSSKLVVFTQNVQPVAQHVMMQAHALRVRQGSL